MSALKDKFSAEVKFSDELKAYHVRVAGKLLTGEDKDKLYEEYEKTIVSTILGWYVKHDGGYSALIPVFRGDQTLTNKMIFKSFSQAKKVLIRHLQTNTDTLRNASKRVRATKKLDAIAEGDLSGV